MGCMGDTTSTTDSTSTYKADPYAYAQYQGLMGRANDLSQRGYNPLTAQNVAGFTDQQRQAFNQIGNLQGSYQPWLAQSAAALGQGAGPVSGAQIAHYMDPYQQQVIDATMAQMQKQGAQQQSQLSGNATMSGALGGNRLGVAQGELAAANQLNQAQTIAGLYSQGYGQALSAAQQDQARQMQASGQYANLGQLYQSLGLQGANALYGAGASQQGLAQRQYDVATANAKAQNMWDYQNLQYAANIAGGLGPLMGGTTTGHSTTEQQQHMGWGNYAMAIGSMLANGGRAGFADGGGVSPGDYNPDPFAQYGLGPMHTTQPVMPQMPQGSTPPPAQDYAKEMGQLGSKARKQLGKMMDSQGGGGMGSMPGMDKIPGMKKLMGESHPTTGNPETVTKSPQVTGQSGPSPTHIGGGGGGGLGGGIPGAGATAATGEGGLGGAGGWGASLEPVAEGAGSAASGAAEGVGATGEVAAGAASGAAGAATGATEAAAATGEAATAAGGAATEAGAGFAEALSGALTAIASIFAKDGGRIKGFADGGNTWAGNGPMLTTATAPGYSTAPAPAAPQTPTPPVSPQATTPTTPPQNTTAVHPTTNSCFGNNGSLQASFSSDPRFQAMFGSGGCFAALEPIIRTLTHGGVSEAPAQQQHSGGGCMGATNNSVGWERNNHGAPAGLMLADGGRARFDDGGDTTEDVGPSSIRGAEDVNSPFYRGPFEKQHPWLAEAGDVAKGLYQGFGEMGGQEAPKPMQPTPAPAPAARELPATEGHPWDAKTEETPAADVNVVQPSTAEAGATGGLAALSNTIHQGEETPQAAEKAEPKPVTNLTTHMGLESGTNDRVASLNNYSPDTKGSRSFGGYGLNTLPGNSAWQFRDDFGKKLGITADPNTAEFKQQWDAAAKKNPQALIAAEDAWHNRYVVEPSLKGMEKSGVPEDFRNSPDVQAYEQDTAVQMGPGLAYGDHRRARMQQALQESNGNKDIYLRKLAEYDKQDIPRYFRTYLSEHPDHVQGLINRVNKRLAGAVMYGSEGPAEAGPAPQGGGGGGLAGGQAPATGATAGGGLAPLVQKGTDPQAPQVSQYTSPQDQQKGGLLKRLFGIDFNPLKLSDNERSGLLHAAFASAGGNPRGIAQSMEYYSGLNEKDRQAQFEGQRLAMQAQQIQQANKQFTTIGHDDLGQPIYGFVDKGTGQVTPAAKAPGAMGGTGGQGGLGDTTLKGTEYLDSVPDDYLRERAASILRGDSPMPKPSKTDYSANAVRQIVLHADSSYNEGAYKFIQNFRDPNKSTDISAKSSDLFYRHSGDLYDLSEDLPAHSTYAQNMAGNWMSRQTNDPKYTAYMDKAFSLAEEKVKAIKGGTPTKGEIEEAMKHYDPSLGKDAIRRNLQEDAKSIDGRIGNLEHDWKKNVNKLAPTPEILSDEGKLARIKILGDMQQKTEAGKVAEGPGGQPLQVGEIRKGYRYKGGNPADKSSWEKAK